MFIDRLKPKERWLRKPIAIASRNFKMAQLTYALTEKEIIGVRFDLYARTFTVIITDL